MTGPKTDPALKPLNDRSRDAATPLNSPQKRHRSKRWQTITTTILVVVLTYILLTAGTPVSALGWASRVVLVIALLLNIWSLVALIKAKSQ